MASLGRTPREFGSDAHSLNLTAQLRLLPLDVNVARLLMGVFRHIFGGHDRRAGDLSSVNHIHDLLNRASLNPTSQEASNSIPAMELGSTAPPFFFCRIKAQNPAHPYSGPTAKMVTRPCRPQQALRARTKQKGKISRLPPHGRVCDHQRNVPPKIARLPERFERLSTAGMGIIALLILSIWPRLQNDVDIDHFVHPDDRYTDGIVRLILRQ